MEENTMKNHLTVAAILQIVFGTFNILIAAGILFGFGLAVALANDPTAEKVLTIIEWPLAGSFGIIGIAMIIGAVGLLARQSWGRVFTLIMAIIGLMSIPLGTLKGVYIIWVLVQHETIAYLQKK
jgi:hypothetical protein